MTKSIIAWHETGDAALGKEVFDISKAEYEPMVEPDGMADDLMETGDLV